MSSSASMQMQPTGQQRRTLLGHLECAMLPLVVGALAVAVCATALLRGGYGVQDCSRCAVPATAVARPLAAGDADPTRPFGGLCEAPVPSVQSSLEAVDLVAQNLDPDFEFWEERPFTLESVNATFQALGGASDLTFLVQASGGKLQLLCRSNDCAEGCNFVFLDLRQRLEGAMAAGRLRLPQRLPFVVNVNDHSRCAADDTCAAPVFSVHKRVGHKDVAVPQFQQAFQVHSRPWALKRPLAFFRGTPYCNEVDHYIAGRRVNCSRLTMSELSRARPDLLNASITVDFVFQGRSWLAEPPVAPGGSGPETPREEHSSYQMLLNLDGYASSTRMGMLLATNSLVLKQESVFMEFYYRSLRPCVHYLPVWFRDEEDVFEVIQGALDDPLAAQAVAANGQAFALVHLNDDAKLRYWEEAVGRYARMMGRRP